jgi:putative NADH-flavin reductase
VQHIYDDPGNLPYYCCSNPQAIMTTASKKLLILGATGGTGQQLVTQALDAGHEVTTFARSSAKVTVQHPRLRLVIGNVTSNGSALADAMRGHDAVISALGIGMSLKPDGLIQRSVPAILSAMETHRVRRLIFTSAIGVGGTFRDAPLFSRVMIRLLLKDVYTDKAAGEELIRRSDLDWTIVQPAQLTNGPLTRKYRFGEHLKLGGIPKIARADVAHFILSQLDESAYLRKVALIGY